MSKQEKISPWLRFVSGIISILGFIAMAFSAAQKGGFQLNFMLFASIFAGFIFLYVAFFGKYPWDVSKADDAD